MQLVIGQRMAEQSAGSREGVVETIVGVVHPVDFKRSLQASFIEAGIVGYKWNRGYEVSSVVECQLFVEEYIGNAVL